MANKSFDYMPLGSQWCGACQGTGKCYECGGTGFLVNWMYTLAGVTIISSIMDILLFLGLFCLAYILTELRLSFNEWIYEGEDVGFWFNPSFWMWLYAKHRRKWVKWGQLLI